MAEIHDLNTTDANNTGRFPENQAPSTVNDGARALEGLVARWYYDSDGSVTGTLSGSVIQITANRSSLTLTGTTSNYVANLTQVFTMGSSTISGPASLNINGIGPISLRDKDGTSLTSSALISGMRVMVVKDNTNNYFRVLVPNITASTPAAFLAYNSATDANQTGNGATATVDFDTEVFDVASNFAADTFTAPVTGKYHLSAQVTVENLSSATSITLRLVTSNRTYTFVDTGPSDGTQAVALSVIADMDANDTATVTIQVAGMAGDTADILGSSSNHTFFSGRFVQ